MPLHSRRASIAPCLRSLAIPDRLAALSRFFRHRALKQASPCLQSPPASIFGSPNAGERSMAGLRGAIELLAIARSRAAAARAAMASASSSSSPPHPRSRRMGERKEGTTLEARAAERATPCRGKSLRPRDGPDAADRHASQHKKSTRCPRHCLVAIVHPTREICSLQCRRDGARYSILDDADAVRSVKWRPRHESKASEMQRTPETDPAMRTGGSEPAWTQLPQLNSSVPVVAHAVPSHLFVH